MLAAYLQGRVAGLGTMEKVRFGVIGTGTWGNVHAEIYSTYNRASLTAVCDLDESSARKTADQWGARRVYTDYREMLRDPASTSSWKSRWRPRARILTRLLKP